MTNTIQAFGRYITVKPLNSDKEFETGIKASHTQANLILKAEVISVGHDEEFADFNDEGCGQILEKGDTVFVHEFPKDGQIDPKTNEEIMFIRVDTVYGYIKKTKK